MTERRPANSDDQFAEIENAFSAFLEHIPPGGRIDVEALRRDHQPFDSLVRKFPTLSGEFWERIIGQVRDTPGSLDPSTAALVRLSELQSEHESRYQDERIIAEGGMGSILEVWDSVLRRHVAMKVIRERSDHLRLLSRFLDEAQITGQLDHPGVATVHELGLDSEGQVYYTMSLVRGRDLESLLPEPRDGEWNRVRILGVVQRAAEALAYAHSRGVIHRDVKPANIMVGRFGETYVMDWGLAKILESDGKEPITSDPIESAIGSGSAMTMEGSVLGTPAFMPPEQAMGDLSRVGPAADIYALGAILYNLIVGRPPYFSPAEEPSAAQIIERVRKGPPAPIGGVAHDAPAELVAICEHAMAREPESRYASMEALAEDLRAFLESRVVAAYSTGPWAEFKSWVRRNRTAATLAGTLVVATILGISAFTWYERRASNEIRLLLDAHLIRSCVHQLDELWPPVPEIADELARWRDTAIDLRERSLPHRAILEAQLRDGPPAASDGRATWLYHRLEEFSDQLPILWSPDPFVNPIASFEQRLQFATTIEERSMHSPDAQRRWAEASRAIEVSSIYGNMKLEPQLGLLPLSPNENGYWEFWHIQSGREPLPNPDSSAVNRWLITEETGIVLILIPAGVALLGAGLEDAGVRKADPAAARESVAALPVHEVELDSYFVGKYEISQPQYQRAVGVNPSRYDGMILPVEQVSWVQSREALHRYSLLLPTEAQWEFAARGGTETPCYFPSEEFNRFANIYSSLDPFPETSPLGSFRPNPFGLHDVIGNVYEWCLDWEGSYRRPVIEGTGERVVSAHAQGARVARGGSWNSPKRAARSAHRSSDHIHAQIDRLGFRAARPVDP